MPCRLPLRGHIPHLAAENEPVCIGICRFEIEFGIASIDLANVVIGGLQALLDRSENDGLVDRLHDVDSFLGRLAQ